MSASPFASDVNRVHDPSPFAEAAAGPVRADRRQPPGPCGQHTTGHSFDPANGLTDEPAPAGASIHHPLPPGAAFREIAVTTSSPPPRPRLGHVGIPGNTTGPGQTTTMDEPTAPLLVTPRRVGCPPPHRRCPLAGAGTLSALFFSHIKLPQATSTIFCLTVN